MIYRAGLLCALIFPAPLSAQTPLSAIDWLSQSVVNESERLNEEPVASAAPLDEITVSSLDQTRKDATGVISARAAGLPVTLWSASQAEDVAAMISAMPTNLLPSLRELLFSIILAELEAPPAQGGDGKLLLSRIDTLLRFGAVDQVLALLVEAQPDEAELFRRWFDASLLISREDRACASMRDSPEIAPTMSARIFCLARGGDWNAAALTLETAAALGEVREDENNLLRQFLDPFLADEEAPVARPDPMTPLTFRMLQAIGEPIPTSTLPVAFAHAELTADAGWKAQIEAAERLSRYGAIDAAQLMSIYALRTPAASGGVWERARHVRDLEKATQRRDTAETARILPEAWAEFRNADLAPAFARYFGVRLLGLPLPAEAAMVAYPVMLLSDIAEPASVARVPETDRDRILGGIARGKVDGLASDDPREAAILAAFTSPELSTHFAARIRDGRMGEALLESILLIGGGETVDPDDLTAALSLLRENGFERVARQAALEVLLLARGPA